MDLVLTLSMKILEMVKGSFQRNDPTLLKITYFKWKGSNTFKFNKGILQPQKLHVWNERDLIFLSSTKRFDIFRDHI